MSATLVLPEPIGPQVDVLDSSAARKVLRWGRRTGKTRVEWIAALLGHGPGWRENNPQYGGVLSGGDVVWIAQNYGALATVLWREEIVPRLGHLPYVTLRTSPTHDVTIKGCGSLLLRSGDRSAIDSVRGVGNRLRGVIVDEAAWLDLRGALQDVILPALLDHRGWLMLGSTTNAGSDGGYDDQGAPQVPSYFNTICHEIASGGRGSDWQMWHATAFDNPVLDPDAIRELIAEYPPDSPKLKQEVYAELLAGGLGLAFPMLCNRHWTEETAPPGPAEWFAGFDWGYQHPWALPYGWRDQDGQVVIRDTLWGRLQEPEEIVRTVRSGLIAPVRAIWSGVDTWARKGQSLGLGHLTIGHMLESSGLPFIKAAPDTLESNVSGVDNLRRYLGWEGTELLPERRPMLQFCRTEGNKRLVEQLGAMQLDPKRVENVLKVDADYAGRGGDDGYEALRRMMQAYPVLVRGSVVDRREAGEGVSPGYDYGARKPRERRTAEEEVAVMFERARPVGVTANRHSIPPGRGGR